MGAREIFIDKLNGRAKTNPTISPSNFCQLCGSNIPPNHTHCDLCMSYAAPTPDMTILQHEVARLAARIEELEKRLATPCHCGASAMIGDYLCESCRANV